MFFFNTYKTKLSSETTHKCILKRVMQSNQKMAVSLSCLWKNKKFCGDSIGTFSEISKTGIDV